MKRIFVLGLFIAGFVVTSQAQDTTAAPAQSNKKVERKQQLADLNLSADQAKQLKAVNKEFHEKSNAIKTNESLSRTEKKEKFASLSKEKTEKLNEFLTPEQQATLKELRKAGHQRNHKTK